MPQESGKILVIDDDEDVLVAARLLLKKHFSAVTVEKAPQNIPALLKEEHYDVILLDMNFGPEGGSGREGFHWLERILQIDPAAVVIFITAFGDVEKAVQAIKAGAFDFVLKPWHNEKLLATVSAALQFRRSRLELSRIRSQQKQLSADMDQGFQEIIGGSAAMQEVFASIQKVAKTDANVLILGENGAGKELVARAIHRQSPRAEKVFISVDVGAISQSLFESELFGHVKGAFTDARQDRPGRFEIASGGSLFLDEIGNLPPGLQAKLLTVLQNRVVTRVGSHRPIPIDIRLICASNLPLRRMAAEGQFRQDLLYRINTVEIRVPPLRERREDIPLLAEHFLRRYGKKYQKPRLRLSPAARQRLQNHHWPGNVRELQHAIERAVIMGESDTLQPGDFFFAPQDLPQPEISLDNYQLEEVEKLVIRKTIEKHGGNVSRAAKELGLTRPALYRRMAKYGL